MQLRVTGHLSDFCNPYFIAQLVKKPINRFAYLLKSGNNQGKLA